MDSDYLTQLRNWQSEMDSRIRLENSWLALAGLFWLEEGSNTFGSDPSHPIVLPERALANIGNFIFDGVTVTLEVNEGKEVFLNGQQAFRSVLDADSVITLDEIRMIIIERPSGTGIRLWDNQRLERRNFPPRNWFPANDHFRVPAIYTPYPENKPVIYPDKFGNLIEDEANGYVTFEYDGKSYTLEATQHEEDRLYIMFRDKTSGQGTYPSGRYYFTNDSVVNGKVTLDFNYAYNPPCAFTPFATCAFAPQQNTLLFRVEAGELYTPTH